MSGTINPYIDESYITVASLHNKNNLISVDSFVSSGVSVFSMSWKIHQTFSCFTPAISATKTGLRDLGNYWFQHVDFDNW